MDKLLETLSFRVTSNRFRLDDTLVEGPSLMMEDSSGEIVKLPDVVVVGIIIDPVGICEFTTEVSLCSAALAVMILEMDGLAVTSPVDNAWAN